MCQKISTVCAPPIPLRVHPCATVQPKTRKPTSKAPDRSAPKLAKLSCPAPSLLTRCLLIFRSYPCPAPSQAPSSNRSPSAAVGHSDARTHALGSTHAPRPCRSPSSRPLVAVVGVSEILEADFGRCVPFVRSILRDVAPPLSPIVQSHSFEAAKNNRYYS